MAAAHARPLSPRAPKPAGSRRAARSVRAPRPPDAPVCFPRRWSPPPRCPSRLRSSPAPPRSARGRGRNGEELGNFEAGSDIVAEGTIVAGSTQGHLAGAALERFGLRGENPQVWALGVKEVWRVRQPLQRVIHT